MSGEDPAPMGNLSPDTYVTSHAGPLTYIWTFLGGAALGLMGGFLQAAYVTLGPVDLPVWAAVSLTAMLVTIRAIATSYGSGKPAVVWFIGWLLVTLLLAMTLPGGDQVIADGTVQLLYVFGGVVLGSAVASIPAQLHSSQMQGSTTGAEVQHASDGGDRDA